MPVQPPPDRPPTPPTPLPRDGPYPPLSPDGTLNLAGWQRTIGTRSSPGAVDLGAWSCAEKFRAALRSRRKLGPALEGG